MARRLYHVEGIIIGSRSQGEASRLLFILTSEFGLITVLARGVREQKSKMRSHLYYWTPLQLSLARGREWWHLTGVQGSRALPLPKVRSTLVPFGRLVIKLLPESSPAPEIYSLVNGGVKFLTAERISGDQKLVDSVELLLVLRFLFLLGYLPPLTIFPAEVWGNEWQIFYLAELKNRERQAVTLINQAIAASQL